MTKLEYSFTPPPPIGQECLEAALLLADRELILDHIPKNGSVLEMGVAYGDFSEKLFRQLRQTDVSSVDGVGWA